jgi:uncharacterized phage-like protein YoqJ
MSENSEKTACFSGYRPHKFDFPLSGGEYDKFTESIYKEISKAIENGYDTFITGMAPGFDIIAGELVIRAKRVYSEKNIKLVCALPYVLFKSSKHFDDVWRERYDGIMKHCYEVISTTNSIVQVADCYGIRNRFMVDNSALLICYSTGKRGGSENTIKYAQSKGITIINIANTT